MHYQKPTKVCVIGAGLVGTTYAYTLLVEGIVDEICLIDVNQSKARGEAMDLNHAVPFARRAKIWAGTMDDVEGSDIVVIAAGAAQKPGETRMDLLFKNKDIVGSIAHDVAERNKDCIIIVVTNPVDVMTYVAKVESGLPWEKVFGSGTILDTARLRFLLGEELQIDPRSIHCQVLGEHGDSELVAWSLASVAGVKLFDWPGFRTELKDEIFQKVKRAAYDIIQLKGATYYAIALALARITRTIVNDLRTVYSVSVYLNGQYGISDVYLGNPSVIGRNGILKVIEEPLSDGEKEILKRSAYLIRKAIDLVYTDKEGAGDVRGLIPLESPVLTAREDSINQVESTRWETSSDIPPTKNPELNRIRPSQIKSRDMKKPRPL